MFTGACGPLEKLSLALAPRSIVLRMIVKLAYSTLRRSLSLKKEKYKNEVPRITDGGSSLKPDSLLSVSIEEIEY